MVDFFSKIFLNDDWYPSWIFFTNPTGFFASFLKSVSVFEHLNSNLEEKNGKKILVLINKMSDTNDKLQKATEALEKELGNIEKKNKKKLKICYQN